jgi:hypothetical protein
MSPTSFPVTIVQPDRAPLPEAARRLEEAPRTLAARALDRLEPEPGLLTVPRHTDQEALWRARARVLAFLQAGGVVASFVEHYRPWLPGARYRHTDHRLTRYTVHRAARHPIFDPVGDRELYEFRGVVGWFAQGYLEPRAEAEVLLRDPDDEALAYVDRASTPGTIFATPGADLPLESPGLDDPVLAGLEHDDVKWHHHGVYHPPREARTLVATPDGGSVLYVDQRPGSGRLVATTMDPDYHTGQGFIPKAERLLEHLVGWAARG